MAPPVRPSSPWQRDLELGAVASSPDDDDIAVLPPLSVLPAASPITGRSRQPTDATLTAGSPLDELEVAKPDDKQDDDAELGIAAGVATARLYDAQAPSDTSSGRGWLRRKVRRWNGDASPVGSLETASSSRSGGGPDGPVREGVRLAPVGPWGERFNAWLLRVQRRRPRLGRMLLWARGPSPAHIETAFPPFPLPFFGPRLHRFELWCTAKLAPVQRYRQWITPVFLLAWFLAFTFLVRASFFNSSTGQGQPNWIVSTTSYWESNDGCGINGTECEPFSDYSYIFRCPSQTLDTELLNQRAIGDISVIYEPLVVGGGDAQGTYRGDSWICAAAIHHGLFGNRKGGCGQLELVGAFENYVGVERNGVRSVGFASEFPRSYRFVEGVSQNGCKDLRDEILGFDVAMSVVYSFFIRPSPLAFYWVLLCLGAWHISLVSDPSTMPPDLESAFRNFLPALFVGESFWRHAWRWVLPAFENSGYILERTVWYLAGFWFGTLENISLSWIPLDRLTPDDISQRPGGLVAVIVLVIFLFCVVVNQLRVIRKTGWFFFYLKWYIVGGIVLGILASLPTLELRLHHYIAALALMPGTAFVTRPSAIFQGFLLGLFLNGAMRWGMDSILQTPDSLRGDGALGSALPVFLTNSSTFVADLADGLIRWLGPEEAGVEGEGWNGFALIVDDVLRQTGAATNFSLAGLDTSIVHYFRLAYQQDGSSGDFTKAATAFLSNGTWINPASGPS
ncbi:uncharacterized protein JCM10292_003882 [Rhodotorula paludigena]|uniref:uncharacterized protein n=1 Tax=Rhodotorula paludigena TaxID=86838 RepID=UPI00317609CC